MLFYGSACDISAHIHYSKLSSHVRRLPISLSFLHVWHLPLLSCGPSYSTWCIIDTSLKHCTLGHSSLAPVASIRIYFDALFSLLYSQPSFFPSFLNAYYYKFQSTLHFPVENRNSIPKLYVTWKVVVRQRFLWAYIKKEISNKPWGVLYDTPNVRFSICLEKTFSCSNILENIWQPCL